MIRSPRDVPMGALGSRLVAVTLLAAVVLLAAGGAATGRGGGKRVIPLTKGTGYCVSVTDDGSFRGKVLVPFLKPTLKRLEVLRQSVGNAVHLIGSEETDQRHQGNILAAAAHVVFEGETIARTGVCITRCACSGKLPDQGREPAAPACGGPCHDCWDCRIDCSGVPGRERPGVEPPPGGGVVLDDGTTPGGD